ncbi:hypothetical protein l11_17420 [Neisseria weaveri LMG 5135]|nr:hypothetical protein l11_17420 [Neisseria weaveri LMG 5135]
MTHVFITTALYKLRQIYYSESDNAGKGRLKKIMFFQTAFVVKHNLMSA